MPRRLPQKRNARSQGKGEIEFTHLKTLSLSWLPTKFVTYFTLKRHRIYWIHEDRRRFQLPILNCSREKNIPMQHLIRKMHDFRYRELLITTNAIKFREGHFEGTVTTPQIIPKFYSSTNSYIKMEEFRESWPAVLWFSKDKHCWVLTPPFDKYNLF